MKKIVVHYSFIPKYRIPIFTLLSQSQQYDYEFWADEKNSGDPYLLTETKGLNVKISKTKYIKIPFLNYPIEWQPSVIRSILFDKIDAYIVNANPYSPSEWACALICRLRRIPSFNWTHGYKKQDKGFKNILRKIFYKLFNVHLLYGTRGKSIMIQNGFSSEKLYTIYNSLDYNTQKAYRDILTYHDRLQKRKQLKIDEDALVLIAIGRLMSKLKIDQAIRAIKMQNDTGQNTSLLIVGDGPDRELLQQLALDLNISDKIIFYGACHDEKELSELYNTAEYSVVIGKVGLSAMHSLAYGIPMITNDNLDEHFPEIDALTHEITGIFFKENDLNDFTAKLQPIQYRDKYYYQCINIIEKYYNPNTQMHIIEKAISENIRD